MTRVTATELGRNLRRALDRVVFEREELLVVRNHEEIARIVPGPGTQTATQAMADLYAVLAPDAGAEWCADARSLESTSPADDLRDPWAG